MSVQSVERTLDVLEALTDAGGQLTLSEIASRTGLPIGTIHRLLRTLVDRGYVRQESDRRYALGAAVLRFGPVSQRLFGDWARPYLTRLVELSGETANMAVMEGDAVVYVAQVPSPRRLRMFAEVGRRVLPHCTAVGKVMLAHRDPAEARRVLQRTGLPRRTEHTVTDADALLAELERVRDAGYAMDLGEEELGVHCAAVPVFEVTEGPGSGRVVAAMSVSGPIDRIDALDRDRLVADMRTVAASFSAEALT